MNRIKLHIDSASPSWTAALAASLPASIECVTAEDSDLIILEGSAGWAARAIDRLSIGHRRLLIADPMGDAGPLDEAITLAKSNGAAVHLSETHADNPAIASFRNVLTSNFSAITVTGQSESALSDMILQQLRLARRCGLEAISHVHAHCDAASAVATFDAVLNAAPLLLRLSIVRTPTAPAHHRLMAHSPTETACIRIDGVADARPAEAFFVTQQHKTVLPTIYEHAHRASLRRLVAGLDLPDWESELTDWRSDVTIAESSVSVAAPAPG